MMKPLRVLMVEDSEQDAALLLRELQKAGYSPLHRRVETAEDMAEALDSQEWDIVLSDYVLPGFSGLAALRLLCDKDLDVPFIVVSGQAGEDVLVEAMKAGAHDYIMKDNLSRLGSAVKRELTEAVSRANRRKAEEDLRSRDEELRLIKKMDIIKDEFIGIVSHELKTPLAVIIGALRVASTEGVSPEEVKELISDAVISAEALSGMVENLLELARFQSRRLDLQEEKASIEPLVRRVAQRIQSRAPIHRIIVDIPDGLPEVLCDPIRVERVLDNLIGNAVKYSPKGGEVRVFCYQQGAQLVIGVRDHGIGISPEQQSRLFQSFQRLDVQKQHDIGGVGLGLRVCRILVEAHSGRIWAESEVGKGSTFFFTLPVSTAHAGESPIQN